MTINDRIIAMLSDNGIKASELLQMDLVMKDKVIYPVSTTLTDYTLFSEATNTGKDTFSRTHKFPLQRGKIYTIHGIRAISNVEVAVTNVSTTPAYNKQLFEQESYFQFTLEKTTLNPVYLEHAIPQAITNIGATAAATLKQEWNAFYFSSPILVPYSGDIQLVFRPRTGLATMATAATNPFYLNGTTGTEGFSIAVELITQEWTIIQ
jgi:hypothetical protein